MYNCCDLANKQHLYDLAIHTTKQEMGLVNKSKIYLKLSLCIDKSTFIFKGGIKNELHSVGVSRALVEAIQ